jgi:hypothetical protein
MPLGREADYLSIFVWSRVSGLMRFLTADQKQQCVSVSPKSFVGSLPMVQPSCSGLSLVMKAGFMVMTLGQSNNLPNGKGRAKSIASSSFSST